MELCWFGDWIYANNELATDVGGEFGPAFFVASRPGKAAERESRFSPPAQCGFRGGRRKSFSGRSRYHGNPKTDSQSRLRRRGGLGGICSARILAPLSSPIPGAARGKIRRPSFRHYHSPERLHFDQSSCG